MLLYQSFREDLVEHIRQEPDESFEKAGTAKEAILSNDQILDNLWALYQKSIEEYNVDPFYAYGDAMAEIRIRVKGWKP